MEAIIIDLEPNPEYWREVYFANANGTVLKSASVKWPYEYTKLSLIVVFIFAALCIYDYDLMDGLLGAVFFFFVSLLYFLRNLRKQYLWRKDMLKFLDGFKKIDSYQIILFEEGIRFNINEESRQTEWSHWEKAERTKRALRLYSKTGYQAIPMKAMSDSDFNVLVDIAERKVSGARTS
jgi:hypothetical protein